MPGAQLVVAAESEHYIQLSQPDLVVDATRVVVDAVRRGDSRVGDGEVADTGATTWILLTIAFVLAGLGLGPRIISTSPSSSNEQRPA